MPANTQNQFLMKMFSVQKLSIYIINKKILWPKNVNSIAQSTDLVYYILDFLLIGTHTYLKPHYVSAYFVYLQIVLPMLCWEKLKVSLLHTGNLRQN